MKKNPLIRILTPLVLLATMGGLLQACGNETECEEGMVNPVRIVFLQRIAATNQLQLTHVDSITVLGINSLANPLYDNRRRVRSIELPLMPLADSTGFVLLFPGSQTDTIWIRHSHQFHLVSPECGFTVFFNLEGLSHTMRTLRGFTIHQPFVSNALEEHISLIIDPATGN